MRICRYLKGKHTHTHAQLQAKQQTRLAHVASLLLNKTSQDSYLTSYIEKEEKKDQKEMKNGNRKVKQSWHEVTL